MAQRDSETFYLKPAHQRSVCLAWLMRQGVSWAGLTRRHCYNSPYVYCACDTPVSPPTPICSHRWPHCMRRTEESSVTVLLHCNDSTSRTNERKSCIICIAVDSKGVHTPFMKNGPMENILEKKKCSETVIFLLHVRSTYIFTYVQGLWKSNIAWSRSEAYKCHSAWNEK
jgi:hypothetical protein